MEGWTPRPPRGEAPYVRPADDGVRRFSQVFKDASTASASASTSSGFRSTARTSGHRDLTDSAGTSFSDADGMTMTAGGFGILPADGSHVRELSESRKSTPLIPGISKSRMITT